MHIAPGSEVPTARGSLTQDEQALLLRFGDKDRERMDRLAAALERIAAALELQNRQ